MHVPLVCLCLLLGIAPADSIQPWWPFTWDTVSVHAFPGAAPRFMNEGELNATSRFNMLNIWGVNATCLNATTGATFPANCGDSRCNCEATSPTPENQTFLTVMETSLHAQSRALKAFKAPAVLPVLGYLNSAVMQQWSVGQNDFNTNESLAAWRMAINASGVIDCFKNGCDYQGMEYRVVDFRQSGARAWWVENVLQPLINSPDIDGTFLDEENNFVTNLCGQFHCNAQELADITAGQLALVEDALAYASSIGKWLCISLTCTFDEIPAYCAAAHDAMLKYGYGMRFYEFFQAQDLEYFTYEAQTLGLPIVAHAGHRTMNPDWVELAIFLIGAGNYSYFSFSSGWDFDSFSWYPEYDQPLGVPLTPALAVNVSQQIPPWQLLPQTSIIFSLPPAPGQSNAAVTFLGNATSAAACAALVNTSAFVGWTYVDATDGVWALACYARVNDGAGDFNASCFPQSQAAPCNVVEQSSCTSAVAFALTYNVTLWTREFEFLNVSFDPRNNTAHITPKE